MSNHNVSDEIDAYLDKVFVGYSGDPAVAADGWQQYLGVAVTAEDIQRLKMRVRDSQMSAMMQCMRLTATDTRFEMEQHLRLLVARAETDGLAHDAAVHATLDRFGEPDKLRRKIRKEMASNCRVRARKADSTNLLSPAALARTVIMMLPWMAYNTLYTTLLYHSALTRIGANALGLIPFLGSLLFSYATSGKTADTIPAALVVC